MKIVGIEEYFCRWAARTFGEVQGILGWRSVLEKGWSLSVPRFHFRTLRLRGQRSNLISDMGSSYASLSRNYGMQVSIYVLFLQNEGGISTYPSNILHY